MQSFSYGNDRYLSGEAADTLSSAVKRDDIAAMIDLLDRGHSLDRKVEAGYTPLMIATGLGNSQLVQLLLDRGADVHILDTNMGASALHKAAQSGVIDVAKLLIEHGAFVDLQSPTLGHTPLIDAVWHKRTAMVRYLLAQGARTELKTHYGATALEFAHRDQLTEIARLLEEHTATVAGKFNHRP